MVLSPSNPVRAEPLSTVHVPDPVACAGRPMTERAPRTSAIAHAKPVRMRSVEDLTPCLARRCVAIRPFSAVMNVGGHDDGKSGALHRAERPLQLRRRRLSGLLCIS